MTTISGIPEADQSPRLRSLEREAIPAQQEVDQNYTNWQDSKRRFERITAEIKEEAEHIKQKTGASS